MKAGRRASEVERMPLPSSRGSTFDCHSSGSALIIIWGFGEAFQIPYSVRSSTEQYPGLGTTLMRTIAARVV